MSHLSNPIATADQVFTNVTNNVLPLELQDSVRFYTARLTQAAGILLRLPQSITAQANVLLYRYWLVDDIMRHEFSDLSAAVIYLAAKISASPRSLRSITNVYAYLISTSSTLSGTTVPEPDPKSYYLSENTYITKRNKLLHIEGQTLNALGFNTHVALPHPLAITYLQTMDVFTSPKTGKEVAKRTIEYLNTALLSPQMLYLTHQPASLATAAIYLAARDKSVRLPECEWWEVFDCEREELGFLVVGMGSLEGVVKREAERWGKEKGMISRKDVREEMWKMGIRNENEVEEPLDEEDELNKLLDARVGA
ncbi:related to cyclin [Phialocephala subalpina]|uniref:Related to cyclin n=1 Tax=Phialocephala subalpina TaxID=576137 RepID=A0A1L7XFQ8_9HELO|nr:related to cyclin [Phialocephala subalpina]